MSIEDPKEIGERKKNFIPFVERSINNWETFYGELIEEAKQLTLANVTRDLEQLSYGELAEHFKKCQRDNLRCWEIHFKTMYVADIVYIMGEQFVKEQGMKEKDYTMMLKGFETKSLTSDRGQFQLCKSAFSKKDVRNFFESEEPTEANIGKIKQTKDGKEWWGELKQYLDEFGYRLTAAILDVNYPTWHEDPTPVIDNIRGMLSKFENRWDFEEDHQAVIRLREESIEKFRNTLGSEPKEIFDENLPKWQKAYQYNEDHWYYLEQVNFSSLRYTALEAAKKFCKLGILDEPDDVFHLTYEELLDILERLEEAEGPASYGYSYLVRPLVAYMKEQYSRALAEKGFPFLGSVPEKIEDPIAIKVFGLTDFVLENAKAQISGEKVELVDKLKGFPGAPGVVEGTARIVIHHDDFPKLKTGDILVCLYTSPAWTPIFPKIRGVVTDS